MKPKPKTLIGKNTELHSCAKTLIGKYTPELHSFARPVITELKLSQKTLNYTHLQNFDWKKLAITLIRTNFNL